LVLEAPQLALAFSAGILGFLSPCALPLMPSYVAYFIGRPETDSRGFRLLRGLAYSIAFGGGFLSVFMVLGLVPSMAIQLMPLSAALLNPLIGVSLIALGLITGLDGLHFKPLGAGLNVPSRRNVFSLFIFGLAYAFASLSCSLPIFLLVVFESASAEGIVGILILYVAYGLGAVSLMVLLTLAVSLSKDYLNRKVMAMLPYVRRLSAVVLIASGAYMILTSVIR
jgi:cytochrome c biogenesis protein CcdA